MEKTKGFCPYHKFFDRHCSWCKAEMMMSQPMRDPKCEICGVTAKEVHVRVLSADPNDSPCYYSWSCENNSCPRIPVDAWGEDPGTEAEIYKLKQWSTFSRPCGCTRIGFTTSPAPILKFNDCSCSACLVRSPHPYHGCECQPYPEAENLKFNAHGDTGLYIGETKVLRVPTFRDIWEIFIDWFKFRKRYFFEPGVCFAVNGEEKGDKVSLQNTGNNP